jgi:hypothetical protein
LVKQEQDGLLWIRISIYDDFTSSTNSALPGASSNVFIVHNARSQFLLTTAMKSEHAEYIIQSLNNALKLKQLKDCNLTGRNISKHSSIHIHLHPLIQIHEESLMEILLNEKSLGGLKSYRDGKKDSNPLSRKRKEINRGKLF